MKVTLLLKYMRGGKRVYDIKTATDGMRSHQNEKFEGSDKGSVYIFFILKNSPPFSPQDKHLTCV